MQLRQSTYPQAPVKAVRSMLNLGSPRPPLVYEPEGLSTRWSFCCELTYWSMTVCRLDSPPMNLAWMSICYNSIERRHPLINESARDESSVARPGVQVIRVRRRRRRDYDTGSSAVRLRAAGPDVGQDARLRDGRLRRHIRVRRARLSTGERAEAEEGKRDGGSETHGTKTLGVGQGGAVGAPLQNQPVFILPECC